MTAQATATALTTLKRTIRVTSTLPKVTTTTTLVVSNPVLVTAAAPVVTETAYTTIQKAGCPPGQTTTWLCVWLHWKGVYWLKYVSTAAPT